MMLKQYELAQVVLQWTVSIQRNSLPNTAYELGLIEWIPVK